MARRFRGLAAKSQRARTNMDQAKKAMNPKKIRTKMIFPGNSFAGVM